MISQYRFCHLLDLLLDGSTLPEVKKSEHGMIGDFELPGDDNARGGKVGGTPGLPGQGGGQPPPPPAVSIPIPIAIPGLPAGGAGIPGGTGAGGLPIGGAGGAGLGVGTDPTQQGIGAGQSGGGINPASTGQGSPVGAIPAGGGQSSGGAQPGGSQPGGAQAGASVAGEGGGSPDGVQVGGLQGQGGAGTSSTTGVSSRPNAIAIGDSTMRIEPGSNPAPGGGNQQVAGPTQQHEKTGSGGKGSSSVTSGGRIEKGRAIPTGL